MERGLEVVRGVAVERGLPEWPLREITGSGSVNHVFVVGGHSDQWVVRFAKDSRSPDVFGAEAWCAGQVVARGVPTPVVSAYRTPLGVPYSVQQFIPGQSGSDYNQPDSSSVLGGYAHVINGIQPDESTPPVLFSRFGQDLAHAWGAHLAYNLARLNDDDPLLRGSVYTRCQQREIREAILRLALVPMQFGLSHGDLTSRNLIIPGAGPPVLIDWGSASFGPVPWTDLLVLDRDGILAQSAAKPDLTAFTAAMDMKLTEMWSTFEAFRQLQLLDLVRWASDHRPDRLPGTIRDLIAIL